MFEYLNTPENVYRLTTILFCIGILISSFEYLYIRKEFKNDGVFSWKIFSSRSDYYRSKLPFKKLNFFFGYNGFLTIQSCRIIACFFLLFIDNHFFKLFFISIIALSSLLFSYRNIIGTDGSDQMNSVICITIFISLLIPDTFILKIGLLFIACQSIISYVVAGIAKLYGVKWRNGQAVYQIMNTKTYGSLSIAKYLAKPKSKIFNYFICWNIILFEILFFLVIVLPQPWCLIFIIWGILFHIYNAIIMGLNSFFWAFMATYPSIIFLSTLTHS